jgi:hypothetical protein
VADHFRERRWESTWASRSAPKEGDRVRLIHCADQYTRLTPGEEGTVRLIDSIGTVHVNWDSGSTLGLVQGEDRFEVIK